LTLELSGDIFCGDACWLSVDTFSSIEYAKRAKCYWSGRQSSISPKEYLFNGEATVKAISLI
jgi:hypothetical protein